MRQRGRPYRGVLGGGFTVTPRKQVCLNLFGGIWMRMVIISLGCLAFRLCIQRGVLDNFMPFLFPSWPCLQVHGGFMPVSYLIVAFGGLDGLAVPLAPSIGRPKSIPMDLYRIDFGCFRPRWGCVGPATI